jgi:hypothetical protein
MPEKVHANDGMRDVGHHEPPGEVSGRRSKLRLKGSHPYVWMVVLLAAQRS